MGGGNHFNIGAAGLVGILLAGSAYAQDDGGLEASLTFSQGLSFSSEDGTVGRTNLGFGLTSTTRNQSLDFALRAGLEQDLDDGLSVEAVSPRATLSYGLENRQSAFTAAASYQQSDTDGFITDADDNPLIVVIDEGTREDVSADLGLTFGREAPFGGSVSLGYRETIFTDTADPDLINERTDFASFGLRFDVSQRISGRLSYRISEVDRDGGRDVRTERLSTGAEFAISPTVNANVSLGVSEVSVTETGVETVTDGFFYDIAVTQTRPIGSLRYSLESNLSETGRRTTAKVGGTFETRRGELSADIGLTEGADDQIRPLLLLSYGEELRRSSYSVSLNQQFTTASDGDETLNSRLRLGWSRDLTNVASISSNVTYQITDVLGKDEDRSRLQLGVSYSHDLTEDWAVTTRVTHSFVEQSDEADTRENEIFIGLETSLGWRP